MGSRGSDFKVPISELVQNINQGNGSEEEQRRFEYNPNSQTNDYSRMTKEQIQQLSGLTVGEFSNLSNQQQTWYVEAVDKRIEQENAQKDKEAENAYNWFMGDNSAVPPSQFVKLKPNTPVITGRYEYGMKYGYTADGKLIGYTGERPPEVVSNHPPFIPYK